MNNNRQGLRLMERQAQRILPFNRRFLSLKPRYILDPPPSRIGTIHPNTMLASNDEKKTVLGSRLYRPYVFDPSPNSLNHDIYLSHTMSSSSSQKSLQNHRWFSILFGGILSFAGLMCLGELEAQWTRKQKEIELHKKLLEGIDEGQQVALLTQSQRFAAADSGVIKSSESTRRKQKKRKSMAEWFKPF
jgi:hypothetical protein